MTATDKLARIFARRRAPAIGGAGVDPMAEGRFMASHYLHARKVRGMTALAALEAAKALPAAYVKGREYYGSRGGAGAPFTRGRSADVYRWIEDVRAVGLRFVGTAEDLARVGHSGWYTDSDNADSLLVGSVWQLAGRKGESRLVYGYRELDGGEELNPGSALICVSDIVRQPMRDQFGNLDETDGARDAARWADGMAEKFAEAERDYRADYNRGVKAAEADAEALAARGRLLPLLGELRALKRLPGGPFGESCPTVWQSLRDKVDSLLARIDEKRQERDNLWSDCPSSSEDAWLCGFMDTADGNGFVRAVRLGWMKASDWKGAPAENPCNA